MTYSILVIETGELCHREIFERLLPAEHGFCCEYLSWDANGERRLESADAHLIILLALGEQVSASGLFGWLQSHTIRAATMAILPELAGHESLRAASEAVDDFVVWPIRELEFRQRIERILARPTEDWQSISERLVKEAGLAQIVGQEPAFVEVIQRISLVANSDAPVLIVGETGTGKELCAHAIHHLSRRARFPFIPLECGAVPEFLAENELFGHARGAYTDAHRDQKGLAALADGGTLFLDEIDLLSPAAQAKLLRFLQDGAYRPLGSERFARANVRVVAAANREIEPLIRGNAFRADLYFRLNVLQLRLPPLRERRGDIALLAQSFLDSFSAAAGGARKRFSPGALRILEQHNWPGNVRELRNVVERAIVFGSGSQILPSDVMVHATAPPVTPASNNFRQARREAIERFERLYVEESLREHHGNITRAALAAGKDRRAFGRLVKKYGVKPGAV